MKYLTFMVFVISSTALVAGPAQEAPSAACVAIIRDALKTAETEGVNAAIARLSVESGGTEKMLVNAFRHVAGQTLTAPAEFKFQLQARTRLMGFEDLQWMLKHDAERHSITTLTSYLPPVTGSVVARVKLANSGVIHLSLSGDRKSIYAQTMDDTLHILDAKTLAVVDSRHLNGPIVRTLAGPDGDLIFRIGEQNIVYIDSLATNERVSRYIGNALPINALVSEDVPVAISPDDRDFITPAGGILHVTDSHGKNKERWDLGILVYPRVSVDEDPVTKKGLSGSPALGIEFVNESDLLVAATDGSVVRVSYPNSKCVSYIKASGSMFHAVAFARDHSRIGFCGPGSTVEVLDADGKVVLKQKGYPTVPAEHEKLKQLGLDPATFRHKFSATRIALASAGQTVAVGDEAGFVHIWSGEKLDYHRIKSHSGSTACLKTAADDKMLISGGVDGCVCVIDPDPNAMSPVALPDTVVPQLVSVDPRHHWRAMYQDSTITVESIPDGNIYCRIPLSPEAKNEMVPVPSVGVAKDRSVVMVGGNGFVLHWNPATQTAQKVPIQVSVPDAETGKPKIVTGPVMISPDGSSCVSWPSGRVVVFDPETGKERFTLSSSSGFIEKFCAWIGDDELAVWRECDPYSMDFRDAYVGPEFSEWKSDRSRHSEFDQEYATGVVVHNVKTNRDTLLIHGTSTQFARAAARAPVVVMSGRQCPDAKHATALVCLLKHREMRSIRLPEKDCHVFGVTNDGTHFLTFTDSEGGILRVWNCDDGSISSQFHLQLPGRFPAVPAFDGSVIRFAYDVGNITFLLHD